jgi:hypothetical protein
VVQAPAPHDFTGLRRKTFTEPRQSGDQISKLRAVLKKGTRCHAVFLLEVCVVFVDGRHAHGRGARAPHRPACWRDAARASRDAWKASNAALGSHGTRLQSDDRQSRGLGGRAAQAQGGDKGRRTLAARSVHRPLSARTADGVGGAQAVGYRPATGASCQPTSAHVGSVEPRRGQH